MGAQHIYLAAWGDELQRGVMKIMKRRAGAVPGNMMGV